MTPLHPLLQRLLVSAAAGAATSGVLVATAEHKGKPRRARRKGKKSPPPAMGAQAAQDAKLPEEHGMTMAELGERLRTAGARALGVFRRRPAPPLSAEGEARLPDEVRGADGRRVTLPHEHGPPRNGNTRKSASGSKRRRRKGRASSRPQATLWDSAKESMRQTVREVVKDEVQQSAVGSAVGDVLQKLKTAGATIQAGAKTAAKKVQASLPENEDIQRTLDQAGKSVVGGLRKLGEALDAERPATRDHDGQVDAPPSDAPAEAAIDEAHGTESRSRHENEGARGDASAADSTGGDAAGRADDGDGAIPVAEKVREGVDVLGGWLQGPGSPGYRTAGSRRVRPAGAPEAVEAKEAPTTASAGEDATATKTPETEDA